MPMATSLRPILNGPSAPMRRSPTSSISPPAASAWPVQAITTGIGNVNTRSNSSAPAVTSERMGSTPEVITLRSKPAENRPGRPASSTAVASFSAWSSASCTELNTSWEYAFAFPSSMVMTATPPSRTQFTDIRRTLRSPDAQASRRAPRRTLPADLQRLRRLEQQGEDRELGHGRVRHRSLRQRFRQQHQVDQEQQQQQQQQWWWRHPSLLRRDQDGVRFLQRHRERP